MPKIVISGVNLKEGGILSILIDCLKSIKELKNDSYYDLDVVALVHSKELIKDFQNDVKIIEYPSIKASWIKRLKFEYVDSYQISKELKPDLWISLHDITPNVFNCTQVVYCHNPCPFYKLKPKEVFYDYKFFLFNLFYKYLYRINIRKNKYVIVQQNWLRASFKKHYSVNTIVAYPKLDIVKDSSEIKYLEYAKKIFFFPSFPRFFKNFEVLLLAGTLLAEQRNDFEIHITLSGKENKYSKELFRQFGKYDFIKFIGLKRREEIFEIYEKSFCIVFPSKLETWGLPLSEAMGFKKPIIASDLQYAYETLSGYDNAKFFPPDNASVLASYMDLLLRGKIEFDIPQKVDIESPFFDNWNDLLKFLIK